jgi:PAS domain S-box-containing protein
MQTKRQTSDRQPANTSPATALFDTAHQFVYTSPTFCQLLGYTSSELSDMDVPRIAQLVYPDDRRSINDYVQELNNPEFIEREDRLRFIKKNGTIALLNRTMKVGRDLDGHPIVVSITLDKI